mgnify:CR=1 FL=1
MKEDNERVEALNAIFDDDPMQKEREKEIRRLENQREVRMVNEGNYIITYSDHEHYVLHRSEKVGKQ